MGQGHQAWAAAAPDVPVRSVTQRPRCSSGRQLRHPNRGAPRAVEVPPCQAPSTVTSITREEQEPRSRLEPGSRAPPLPWRPRRHHRPLPRAREGPSGTQALAVTPPLLPSAEPVTSAVGCVSVCATQKPRCPEDQKISDFWDLTSTWRCEGLTALSGPHAANTCPLPAPGARPLGLGRGGNPRLRRPAEAGPSQVRVPASVRTCAGRRAQGPVHQPDRARFSKQPPLGPPRLWAPALPLICTVQINYTL